MFKYIFKIAVWTTVLSSSFLFAFNKSNKEIRVEDLHIFNIFNNAKVVLMEDLAAASHSTESHSTVGPSTVAQKPSETKPFEKMSLDLVKKEIELLKEIIQGFNNGLLLLVEYKFVSVCNFFRQLDAIEPRNIRAFKRKVTKFDNFIQDYSLKKKSMLDKDEVELCEKILNFNQILLTCFLRYDFYNIDTVDRVIDACFFRPVEIMGEYPLATSVVIVVLSILFFRYCVYPYFNNFYNCDENGPVEDNGQLKKIDPKSVALDEEHPTLENKNRQIDVAQIKVFPQNGRMCGAHAAFRLIAFHESHGDVVQAYRIANDAKRFNECCSHWSEITGVSSLNDLHSRHLDTIIKDYNVAHTDNPIPADDYMIIDDSKGVRDPSSGFFAETYGIDDEVDSLGVVPGKRTRLNAGRTQYVIINTAENGVPSEFGEHKDSDKAEQMQDKKDEGPKDKEKPKEGTDQKPKDGQQYKEQSKEGTVPQPETEQSWFGQLMDFIFGKNSDGSGNSGSAGKNASTAKRSKKWYRTSYGHWLPFMFVPDPGVKDGVRVIMADSMGNPDRTRDPILTGLHRMLVHGS